MSLEYVALGMLIFVGIVFFYGILAIHDIPYEIAKNAATRIWKRFIMPARPLSRPSGRPCAPLRRSPDRSCPKILCPVSPPLSGAGVLVFKNAALAELGRGNVLMDRDPAASHIIWLDRIGIQRGTTS